MMSISVRTIIFYDRSQHSWMVKLLTKSSAGISDVSVDVEEDMSMALLKEKLEALTGIPIEYQKVMLAGIGQMVLADKRSTIGFSHCGSTNSLYFGMLEVKPAPGASSPAGGANAS